MKVVFLVLTLLTACSSNQPRPYTADPEGIRQRMIDELPELRKCSTQNSIDKKIESKLSFVIQSDGSTSDHKIIESSSADKELEDCVLRKAAKFKFQPVPDGGNITIKQPFNYWRKP